MMCGIIVVWAVVLAVVPVTTAADWLWRFPTTATTTSPLLYIIFTTQFSRRL
jgi:hypothetical protein